MPPGAMSANWPDASYLGQLAPLNQQRWLGQAGRTSGGLEKIPNNIRSKHVSKNMMCKIYSANDGVECRRLKGHGMTWHDMA